MLINRLIFNLKEAKKNKEQYVTSVYINDLASYKFLVGEIKGLQDAIDICEKLFKGELENE